ncbi:hypothetical protein RKE29_28305 [Streptomyces sp. B1866]|uniref:hypothetical protein n=1 Tax=Streptomyces sp. B1866 TaxID=3075431 RepID=UPI00288CE2E8|nr:hypothetical protein [Streptomyces sp. B1866]MDT3400465.1 hypothetical protein [Streptomyces sp. B1866]
MADVDRTGGEDPQDPQEPQDPARVARLRLAVYVEALRARMPEAQFDLLWQAVTLWVEAGGGKVRLRMDPEDRELFTAEVQRELLTLIGLIGALEPGHEDRADHVVADLGDGTHAKGAMSLVPPSVAADPERLRAMRDRLDASEELSRSDAAELEGIARASGMMPGEED